MRRRALLAASKPSSGDIYLTLNTTNADNIKAYNLISKECFVNDSGITEWFPSGTNIYVSGEVGRATFSKAQILHADTVYGNRWEILFEDMYKIGGNPVCSLYSDGLLEAYDDD